MGRKENFHTPWKAPAWKPASQCFSKDNVNQNDCFVFRLAVKPGKRNLTFQNLSHEIKYGRNETFKIKCKCLKRYTKSKCFDKYKKFMLVKWFIFSKLLRKLFWGKKLGATIANSYKNTLLDSNIVTVLSYIFWSKVIVGLDAHFKMIF